jgi:hypothetical protein
VELLRSQRAFALLQRFDDRGALNCGAAGAGARVLDLWDVGRLTDNDSRF